MLPVTITPTADVITIPDIDVITDIQDLYYMLPVLSVIITPHLPIQLMLLQPLILMSLLTSRTFITCYRVVCYHHSSLTHTADVITVPDIDVIPDIQDLYYMLPVLSVIITPHLPIQLMLLQPLILISLLTSRTFITCYRVVCYHHSSLTHTADVITVPDIDVVPDIQDLYYMLPVLSVIITPHLPIQLMLLQSLIFYYYP